MYSVIVDFGLRGGVLMGNGDVNDGRLADRRLSLLEWVLAEKIMEVGWPCWPP